MILTFDAEANFRDGQEETSAYATNFKSTIGGETEARACGLLGRTQGKARWSLAKAATDDFYSRWQERKRLNQL